jgi:hypothetical protein
MLKLASVLAASVLTLGCALTPETWPHVPFDSQAWKSARGMNATSTTRASPSSASSTVRRATRDRAARHANGNKSRTDSITYLVRKRRLNPWMAEVRILDIRLTPEGKVDRYFIRGT